MAKKQHSGPSGLIVVDKPAGMTSHDVVSRVRRLAKTSRVGHAGTLDPMATGLLILGVGKATKLLRWLVGESKTYRATIRLGAVTVTDDAEGQLVELADPGRLAALTPELIGQETKKLTGDIMQVPSAVSAIRVNGVRAYARVRGGEQVRLDPRPVRVSDFSVHGIDTVETDVSGRKFCDLDVTVSCSAGTYIRALARDLGAALGVGGHVRALRRTRVGGVELREAHTLVDLEETVESGHRLPLLLLDDVAARLFPVRSLSPEQATDLSYGRPIEPEPVLSDTGRGTGEKSRGVVAAYAPSGQLVALVENREVKGRQVSAPVLVFEAGQRFDRAFETGVQQ